MSAKLEIDQGPANRDSEGAFRRGYHQAVAEVAYAIRHKQLNVDDLQSWVEGSGMHWRKDVTLERMILPPDIG